MKKILMALAFAVTSLTAYSQPNPKFTELENYLNSIGFGTFYWQINTGEGILYRMKGNFIMTNESSSLMAQDSIRKVFSNLSSTASESYLYEFHKGERDTIDYSIAFAKEDEDLYYLRFKNLSETTPLKYMLSDKVGRFTQTQGVIQGVYPVRPKLKEAVFECRGCMRLHEVEQNPVTDTILEPSLCSECGGRSFRLLENKSTYINERLLLITEPQEELNFEDNPRQNKQRFFKF